ncbi:hypothetical protein [Sorangium sp. So ce1099]|uniref:hypothetical protein n=1 Tax=Sorangium sp. So ce1099 TaxID=3133331 RepID=UPI003F64300B
MTNQPISLGSRERFGVELRVFPQLRGVFADVTLWIHGEPLGRIDDPVAVYSFMSALTGMARSTGDSLVAEALESPAAEAWARLEAEGHRYKMPPIDFFDPYEAYCIADARVVRYLWRERPQDSEEAGALHDATLPRSDVEGVLAELRATYEELAALPPPAS